jgi:hypothetical protein
MSLTAKPPNHPSTNIFVTKSRYAAVYPGLYLGSVIKPLNPITKESSQGTVNKISIEVSIATAPAALLGNAFNIA